jgi:hypothetical protein
MDRHIMPLFPIVGLMFIRLCTTSKCNYLTYNTILYTREKEERGKRKKEKGKRKKEKGNGKLVREKREH